MISITDHALLRYMERVHGVDMEALRRRLQEQLARSAASAAALEQKTYTIRAEGHDYIIVDGRCVTVAPARLGRRVREDRR